MTTKVVWTQELMDFLVAQQALGNSAAQIAAMIPGATRNAIIGKLHRLGVSGARGAKKGVSRSHKPRSSSAPGSHPNSLENLRRPKVAIPFVEPVPVTLEQQRLHSRRYADLEDGMCYWPLYYEGAVQMYCAGVVEPRKSYCKCHLVMSAPPRNATRADKPRNHGYVPISRFR